MNNNESLNLSSSRLKLITTIKRDYNVNSMCLLGDGRLVSGGKEGIVIYRKHSFQSDIIIKDYVYSVCGLRNRNLAYGGEDDDIRIYEIDGNEHKHIHTLKAHTGYVNKVIELEDGRLSSCSVDNTIIIWDEKYKPIRTLKGHTDSVMSIIEMNHYIISSTYYDGVRIWNKHTYKCIKTIPHLYCENNNGLSKLGENTIIIGGSNELFVLDILSFQSKSFWDLTLGYIWSILVLREDQILLGNVKGEIVCYDSLSNQIIFTQSLHTNYVTCIIETEDKKILSSSKDDEINIYELGV